MSLSEALPGLKWCLWLCTGAWTLLTLLGTGSWTLLLLTVGREYMLAACAAVSMSFAPCLLPACAWLIEEALPHCLLADAAEVMQLSEKMRQLVSQGTQVLLEQVGLPVFGCKLR